MTDVRRSHKLKDGADETVLSDPRDEATMSKGFCERDADSVVVGLGSPIMCDDAVGLRISEEIQALGLPGVDCCQEAVGGLDILPVIHGYRYAVIVDAIQTMRYDPGTVLLFKESDFEEAIAGASCHDVNLPTAVKIGRQMDPEIMPEEIRFVAVEVQDIRTMSETMTPAVEAAVESGKSAVLHILKELRGRAPAGRRRPAFCRPSRGPPRSGAPA
jgi:hydrogenase maturation protease